MTKLDNEAKMKVTRLNNSDKLQYLNGFTIDYLSKSGKTKVWELVSRQGRRRLENEIFEGASYTDGAMIFAVDKDEEKVVILKEFRVSAGKYVYMLPAGLVEENEDIKDGSKREFKEETGMDLEPVYIEKERYVSVGITNEKVNIVYGYYLGEPSKENQEDNEDAEILIIDRKEAVRILNEEEVSIRTAMLLESFYNINPFFNRKK